MFREEGKQEEVGNLTELSILCSPAKGCEYFDMLATLTFLFSSLRHWS